MKVNNSKNKNNNLQNPLPNKVIIYLFLNVINVEIIKLMKIYFVFLDRFILMELLYSLLGLSKNSLIR